MVKFDEHTSIQTSISGEVVTKLYKNISSYHICRLIRAYLDFDAVNIGPHVYSCTIKDGKTLRVKMEKVIPLTRYLPTHPDEVAVTSGEIVNKVRQMHSLGYGHGDLWTGNIGIRDNGAIVFLDLDTVFRIEGESEWIYRIMYHEYDDYFKTLKELAEYDYKKWDEMMDDVVAGEFIDH